MLSNLRFRMQHPGLESESLRLLSFGCCAGEVPNSWSARVSG